MIDRCGFNAEWLEVRVPRRWRRRAAAAVVTLAVIIALRLVWLATSYDYRLRRAAAAGAPISIEQLHTVYGASATPFSRRMQHAAELLPPAMAEVQPWIAWRQLPHSVADLSPDVIDAARDYVTVARDSLDAVHAAAKMADRRFPLNFSNPYSVKIDHLSAVERLSWLLAMQALVAAVDSDAPRTVDALFAMLRLADSLAGEPLIVSHLERLRELNRVADVVGLVALRVRFTDEQRRALAEAIACAVDRDQITRIIMADRVLRAAGPGSDYAVDDAALASLVSVPPTDRYLDVVAHYLDEVKHSPDYALLDRLEHIEAEWRASLSGENANRFTLRITTQMARVNLIALARMRAAAVAIAAAGACDTSGTVPAADGNWTRLLPPNAGIDPFCARPLRFAAYSGCDRGGSGGHAVGFIVYSTGPDRSDNGGGSPGLLYGADADVSVLLTW